MDPETPAAMVERGTLAAQRSVVSTLAELPAAVEREGWARRRCSSSAPRSGTRSSSTGSRRRPLAGERLVDQRAAAGAGRGPGGGGRRGRARCPRPVTPAARVVIGAAPLTGCVLRHARRRWTWLDEERGATGWEEDPVAWCLDGETAERARELGWRRVRTCAGPADAEEIVSRIAGQRTTRA